MMQDNNKRQDQIKLYISDNRYIILVAFFVFIAFYTLSIFFPFYNDDWNYSLMMDGKPIDGFIDILRNQYDHYFKWGGRSIVHIILQILLYMGECWADILNSLAYVILTFLIYSLANFYNKTNIILFVFISFLIWFLVPSYGDIIWITGSANYLWGTLIILFFIYPYCAYYTGQQTESSVLKNILFFLGGIIAGWTNENMAIALIFFIISLFILIINEKKKIPLWAIIGLIGAVIGCVIMLIAPGNLVRYTAETANEVGAQTVGNKLLVYSERFIYIIKRYSHFPLIYIGLLLIYLWRGGKRNRGIIIKLSSLFILTSLVAATAMIVAPIFPKRAWFGIVIFAIIPIAMMYANINFKLRHIKIGNYIVLFIATVLFSISYTNTLIELISIRKVVDKREKAIKEQKAMGIQNIVVYGQFPYSKSKWAKAKIVDMPLNDPNDWTCKVYANYWGVRSITILPEK